ncbi:hypothetical protein SBOR_10026 [Sclerotinia borealis F-4128]|uniref:Uncharacterized protein n=1 Tax=Sclerotinia borealis (strain F-4128) TaxID=1432307 RepID=W9C4T9_SCLBF|nr:hypothetical protein SBOR_10026 [Sclerotinia borealis F-4128]
MTTTWIRHVLGQAESASGEVDTGRIELDASLHNSLLTSELASAPTESIDTSGPWYDVEETTPGLGSHEQHSVPSAPAQAQPLQDQTHQQGVGSIAQSTSVESALHSLLKSSDSGDDGWTDKNMAELEKELGLAWESNKWSHHRPAHLPPQVLARPRHHRTRSRVENAAKPLGLEWEQQETRVAVESLGRRELGEEALMEEAGGVEIRQQGELAGDQQNQAEVDDTDDPMETRRE